MKTMQKGKILRVTFSVTMILAGLVMSLWDLTGKTGEVLSNFGLAFVIAGVASMFRDLALMKLENEETSADISDNLEKKLSKFFPPKSGIQLVADVRRGWEGYYLWATTTRTQELFFAGRSVLHRINQDFKERSLPDAEDVIFRKLTEGCEIRILFLDPRTNIIGRLAKEEGQDLDKMLEDIATSLGICKRLYNLLSKNNVTARAFLSIRVYDEVPYFAYHKVDNTVNAGFYFSTTLGHQSSAYEIIDEKNKKLFSGHFTSIHDRAEKTYILELPIHHRTTPKFNYRLFQEIFESISGTLGEEKTRQLMSMSAC